MILTLSPAKSLDFDTPWQVKSVTQPRLLEESQTLIDVMRGFSPAELSNLMGISDELAAMNADRYLEFETPFTPHNAKPAILAFTGDVYQGMDAANRFDRSDLERSQLVVRILSGLYGVLRPLDLMQPYRLEMGTKLRTERGKDLYQFWGSRITDVLRQDLENSPGEPVLVNLASQEYFRSVKATDFGEHIISPRFEDTNAQGKRSVISFYAKRARGEMAGWIVRNRVETAQQLTEFAEAGYRFDPESSTPAEPVFVRAFDDR